MGDGALGRRGGGGQLVLRKLTKHYAGMTVVDGIDLAVEAGEFLTLLGPSGSGKTTTLMMIAGFTPPSDGAIHLNGASIAGLPPERRNIGVVFQNYALFPHMTVFDNIAFPLRMRRRSRGEIAEKVKAALRLVRLDGFAERLPRQLSGGQQQRVAFARALVFDPTLLLMDEPLGALDKNLRSQMQFELKRLHGELGVTIIYVTHDQEEALTMSDRIALMNQGGIEQLGSAEDLYERPVSRFVAEFIGESNLIEGRIEAGSDGRQAHFAAVGGARLPVATDGTAIRPGESGILVVRPESLAFVPPDPPGDGIPARVIELVYVGDFMRYFVEAQGGLQLTLKIPNSRDSRRAKAGDEIRLSLDPLGARFLRA